MEADHLRSLLDGVHPPSGQELTVGFPDRRVRAIDVRFSTPNSINLLWGARSGPLAETVMFRHTPPPWPPRSGSWSVTPRWPAARWMVRRRMPGWGGGGWDRAPHVEGG